MDNECGAMDIEDRANFPCKDAAFPNLRWKRGVELPPLARDNPAAVALVQSILEGTIVEWPAIVVSEAVAELIYRLMLDKDRRAALFAQSSWAQVYAVLASLARRERVQPTQPRAIGCG
eukprot:5287695-Prymnesium_polylepis.1